MKTCSSTSDAAQGLTLCGAALCTLVSAASQQLFTAALARLVLGRRLSSAQNASVSTCLTADPSLPAESIVAWAAQSLAFPDEAAAPLFSCLVPASKSQYELNFCCSRQHAGLNACLMIPERLLLTSNAAAASVGDCRLGYQSLWG